MSDETVIHSHWHQSIPGLKINPSDFYARVGEAITKHQVPDVHVSGTYFSEGGVGSAQRL